MSTVESARAWHVRAAPLAATVAGLLYAARSWHVLAERQLDHMRHAYTADSRAFLAVPLLMAVVLLGLRGAAAGARARDALTLAVGGLLWEGTGRALEAWGAPGAWGFYSSPGMAATFVGVLAGGWSFARSTGTRGVGWTLVAVALLRLGGGLASMVLFNVLGRTEAANWAATVAGRSLHLAEAAGWMVLGVLMLARERAPARGASAAARA
jgi:hypothetical protein